jgi:hypothetical protein
MPAWSGPLAGNDGIPAGVPDAASKGGMAA